MAKTQSRKSDEHGNVLEDPDVMVGRAEDFFNDKKNRNVVLGIGGVLALVVAAFLIYNFMSTNKNIEAQNEMFQAVYYFEADSLGKALNGDGVNYGFLEIVDEYGGTEAANLSNFYAGAIYMKLKDFQGAIRYLENFSSSDLLVQARAYSLIGDANLELGNYDEAVSAYEQAVSHKPNEEYTPIYLQKLAVAQEARGNYSMAADAYDELIGDYPSSQLTPEAKKQKARLQGLAAE